MDQPREKLNRICLDIIGVSLDTFGDEGYIPQPLYPPPRDDYDDEDLDTRSDQWYFSPPSGDDRLL